MRSQSFRAIPAGKHPQSAKLPVDDFRSKMVACRRPVAVELVVEGIRVLSDEIRQEIDDRHGESSTELLQDLVGLVEIRGAIEPLRRRDYEQDHRHAVL